MERPRDPLRGSRNFYFLAGAVALLVAFGNVSGPVQGALGGCSVVVPLLGIEVFGRPYDPMLGSCTYYLDLVAFLLPLLAGLILVIGAWRYHRTDPFSSAATALAVPVGVVAGSAPLYVAWWLIDYYNLDIGPTEVGMVVLGLAVAGWALLAGWRTVRHLLARRVGVAAA